MIARISPRHRIAPIVCSVKHNDKSTQSKMSTPPEKTKLRGKLKYALMNCDIQSENYKLHKQYCDILWKEVDDLAKKVKT